MARLAYLSNGWNFPNLGDLEPSVMTIRSAQTEPPTQYWSVDRVCTDVAAEDFADFEYQSNMEKPAFDESFSPQSGNFRIEPPPPMAESLSAPGEVHEMD